MPGANDLLDYWVDAWHRSILLLDVLRQRGNNCAEHNARTAPNVLSFDAELVLDGRSLPRPVNYGLVRIVPPYFTSRRLRRPAMAISYRSIRSSAARAFVIDVMIGCRAPKAPRRL
jgi:hypothetical protein